MPEELDTTLTEIWHNATVATGCLADAIRTMKRQPGKSVRADIAEAARLLEKAHFQTRQYLSDQTNR
jgi:cellobiose-specific phosphotransferase system component IIA